MNENSDLVRDLVFEIQRISKKLDVKPQTITKAQFLKETKEFKEWDLRKVGGLGALIKTYFRQTDRDLQTIQSNKRHISYVNKLERIVGDREAFQTKLIKNIGNVIKKTRIEAHPLDPKTTKEYLKSLKIPSSKSKTPYDVERRSVCTIWSDQHFGTNVDKEEMGGLNEYNWKIGARRLGLLCEQIATYKIEKRHLHDELVIYLIGDNIAGVIHDQEGPGNDLMSYQLNGTFSYYVQALNYLKEFFPKIRVECQPGNHGRFMHKMSKNRVRQNKFDSFENSIFYGLSMVFGRDPKVQVNVPKSPFLDVTVQGHRTFATHGDTVFETGNVGKSINISKLEHQVNSVNAEERDKGKKQYELFCTGHVHHPLFTHVSSGIKVIVNGCLIGTDPFAKSIGIHASLPVQVLWETTPKYVQGDSRNIYVNSADDQKRYEKIIRPYNYELQAVIQ